MTANEGTGYSSLIAAFWALTLQQQETQIELEQLREEVQQLRTRVDEREKAEAVLIEAMVVEAPESNEQSSTTSEIVIGDTVVLINPGRARSNRGQVTGITGGGFLGLR